MRSRYADLCAVLLLVLSAAMAQAKDDPPRQGLMWNRTGLPAVFPLQVKTLVGQNYVLLLSDYQSNADVLGAYIIGGEFFRVLVPPGTYRVRFASGIKWQGEDKMFGTLGQTKVIEMPEPLTFEVVGLRTKKGHLIDLTTLASGEATQATNSPLHICQSIMLAAKNEFAALSEGAQRQSRLPRPIYHKVRSRYCWQS